MSGEVEEVKVSVVDFKSNLSKLWKWRFVFENDKKANEKIISDLNDLENFVICMFSELESLRKEKQHYASHLEVLSWSAGVV